MADVFSTATAVGFLVVIIYYLWRVNQKSYRLPPGPKQNLIFGNLMELIYSTVIQGEPALVKFSQWAFKVKVIHSIFTTRSDSNFHLPTS
jgi:hypothetical protein